MLAALLLGMVAVAKEPNTGVKRANKSNAQSTGTNHQQDGAAKSTVISTTTAQQVINREASSVDAKAADHVHPPNSGSSEKSWLDSQFWFNLLLVICTGLLAFLAYRQLKAMHRQADLMSGQLAEMKTTSVDTHNLAAAAQEQAMASKETAMAASYSYRRDASDGRAACSSTSPHLVGGCRQTERGDNSPTT